MANTMTTKCSYVNQEGVDGRRTSETINSSVVVIVIIIVLIGIMLTITVTLTIIPFFPLLRFSQLFLPDVVGGVGVQVREDEVEDVGIPARGMAVDAFFDVLFQFS